MCTIAILEIRRRGEPTETLPFTDEDLLQKRIAALVDTTGPNTVEEFVVFRPKAVTTRQVTFVTETDLSPR